MKLQRKGTRHSHRGVIGVESAIVMIAFVIVAAALAFVVLNMGFTTSQKAKTTILSSLAEATSSLQISGKVTGVGCTSESSDVNCSTTSKLNATAFPLKITSGGNAVNLAASTTAIKYLSNSVEYDDIYAGPITGAEYKSLAAALTQATRETGSSFDAFNDDAHAISNSTTSSTKAIIYWTQQFNTNAVLEPGEHAVLTIAYDSTDRPSGLDTIKVELIAATGAALTVERQVPNIASSVIDLG